MTLSAAESRSALVHRLGRQVRQPRALTRARSVPPPPGRIAGRSVLGRVGERHLVGSLGGVFDDGGGVLDGAVNGGAEEGGGAADDVDDVRRARRGHEVLHGGCALRVTGRERSGEVRSATAGGRVKKTIRAGAFRGVESVAPRLTWGSLAGARPAGERRGCPPRLPPPPTMLVTVDATEVTADATSFSNAPHSSQSCARGVGWDPS